MKSQVLFSILILSLALGSVGCRTTAQERQLKVEDRLNKANVVLFEKQQDLQDKGKAYVFGAGLSLSKIPHGIHPGLDIAEDFVNLAKITLGPPSLSDSQKIDAIVEGLFNKVELEAQQARELAAQAKSEELKAKASELKSRAELATTKQEKDKLIAEFDLVKQAIKFQENEIKTAQDEAKDLKKKYDQAQANLVSFTGKIIYLENELKVLEGKHKGEIEGLIKLGRKTALDSDKWAEENSFVNSINPFRDFWKGTKKIIGWVAFLTGITILFKVLEIFFPQFSIFGSTLGLIFKGVAKVFPSAKRGAGVVSKSVYNTLAQVVKAKEKFFDELKQLPVEDKLVENYPDDYKFSKKETLSLLHALTEQTIESLRNKLKEQTDSESRSIIDYVKADTGIKDQNNSPNI